MDKAEVLNHIRKSFHKDTDLISWMNTPIKKNLKKRVGHKDNFCARLYMMSLKILDFTQGSIMMSWKDLIKNWETY